MRRLWKTAISSSAKCSRSGETSGSRVSSNIASQYAGKPSRAVSISFQMLVCSSIVPPEEKRSRSLAVASKSKSAASGQRELVRTTSETTSKSLPVLPVTLMNRLARIIEDIRILPASWPTCYYNSALPKIPVRFGASYSPISTYGTRYVRLTLPQNVVSWLGSLTASRAEQGRPSHGSGLPVLGRGGPLRSPARCFLSGAGCASFRVRGLRAGGHARASRSCPCRLRRGSGRGPPRRCRSASAPPAARGHSAC